MVSLLSVRIRSVFTPTFGIGSPKYLSSIVMEPTFKINAISSPSSYYQNWPSMMEHFAGLKSCHVPFSYSLKTPFTRIASSAVARKNNRLSFAKRRCNIPDFFYKSSALVSNSSWSNVSEGQRGSHQQKGTSKEWVDLLDVILLSNSSFEAFYHLIQLSIR
jgi:hypothetical protein